MLGGACQGLNRRKRFQELKIVGHTLIYPWFVGGLSPITRSYKGPEFRAKASPACSIYTI